MSCRFSWRVDRHFTRAIDPGSEHSLREHLADCADCRGRYERRLLLERLDPNARGAEERLGRGLGLQPSPVRWVGFTAAFAAAATALFLLLPQQQGYVGTRGGGAKVTKSTVPELMVYKLRPGAPSRPAGEAIAAKDELAFAYRNPSEARYLLVFGVDEHKHVYWYHPAWLEPEKKPVAVKISQQDDALHELPEAIVHPLDGQRLDIVAVFAPRPVSVSEIEERIAQRGGDCALGIAGAVEARTRLKVEK